MNVVATSEGTQLKARSKAQKPRPPGIRIVDGKRIDLRKRAEMRKLAKQRPEPTDESRAADQRSRAKAKQSNARRDRAEMRAVRAMGDGGADGAVTEAVEIKLSSARAGARSIRCRPGTFEWRYGRKSDLGPLYHAGVHFADLWERAGTAAASSPDFNGGMGGQWKGLPDGRLLAMQQIDAARKDIGRLGTSRLVDYCVMGTTSADMASKYGVDERAMSHVLMMDLRSCAMHFRFL